MGTLATDCAYCGIDLNEAASRGRAPKEVGPDVWACQPSCEAKLTNHGFSSLVSQIVNEAGPALDEQRGLSTNGLHVICLVKGRYTASWGPLAEPVVKVHGASADDALRRLLFALCEAGALR